MALQYNDDSFSETMPLEEAIEKLQADPTKVKALHVGDKLTIEQVKNRVSIEQRLNALEEKMDLLTAEQRGILKIPTQEEINRLG